jgi:hypothetical protein
MKMMELNAKRNVQLRRQLHQEETQVGWFAGFMVFNATFNNISVISCLSISLVEETEVPGENHRPVASHWQIYHIMLYTSSWAGFELTILVVIGTDCISRWKFNYQQLSCDKLS